MGERKALIGLCRDELQWEVSRTKGVWEGYWKTDSKAQLKWNTYIGNVHHIDNAHTHIQFKANQLL